MGSILAAVLLTAAVPPSAFESLFRAADAKGAAVAVDARTGAVIASVAAGRGVDQPVLPLSVIKLYVAAVWWERGLGGSLDDMLVDGRDQPGSDRALELRRRFGGAAVLEDLRRHGLDSLKLAADADDAAWGDTLSLGERHVTVTLPQVARFLRAIAASRSDASERLQAAMRACVERGTARSLAPRQAGAPWKIGGKTGTGPDTAKPYDGVFAGLVFVEGEPRYAVAVYVKGRGPGGGVAASIAADMARILASSGR
jgi:membrane peptidoglycan carboxypeptidase